jgi:hypothetical protein
MKGSIYVLCTVVLALLTASCNTRRVNYECQCFDAGVPTNNYEIGKVSDEVVNERCHAMQQQNGEDTCIAAGMLK